jgi:hypothetical protein
MAAATVWRGWRSHAVVKPVLHDLLVMPWAFSFLSLQIPNRIDQSAH